MKNKGQSTVEYILVVTAVISVIILFTTSRKDGFQNRLANVFEQSTESMVNVTNRLATSN